jgi:hypothetical protein
MRCLCFYWLSRSRINKWVHVVNEQSDGDTERNGYEWA